ncbi:MAG: serine protease [Actinomycetota bacterium]|nr:serine protease [Actinomycetota bacterium]
MRRRVILLLATMAVALLLACAAALAADAQDYEAQVVGGTAVPNGKYSFVAALMDTRRPGDDHDEQFCGGALIDPDSVLTAAHCVRGMPAGALEVTVGRTVLSSDQGQKRSVTNIFIHPNYNSRTNARDAAVLKLRRAVSGIAPIELATKDQNYLERAGRYATVAGWGNTIKQPANGCLIPCDSNYPDRMREARVPLVSDADAKDVYGQSYISKLMVAAGREGKDTCQGDSGGPMFAKTDNGPRQIGITSWGAGCGARGHPGVYAEVNAGTIRSFITDAASR